MGRKDYKLVARGFHAALKEIGPSDAVGRKVWSDCVLSVAAHLKVDNPRFKHTTFLKACALGSEHSTTTTLKEVQDV